MTSRYETALASVRVLLGIVAGLGITNTLNQLFKLTPDPMIRLTHFTTHISRDFGMNLGQGKLLPFSLVVMQIILAIRFYQASSVSMYDMVLTKKCHYSFSACEYLVEGILIAASSFYIHYPLDFIILIGTLLLINGIATRLTSRYRDEQLWGLWNGGFGLALLVWYCLFFYTQPYTLFFIVVVALLVVNTLLVAYLYGRKYFPPAEQVAVPVPVALLQRVKQYAQGNGISLEEATNALLGQALNP